ncbi:MAG: YraN family protein [Gammaproteobacteria bacterium]|nr:MAG: YraN family protein [Gammaproteobacteria bacterium]TLZ43454.1 MAG: YraN family protein [Gammaproteobacteria bacterium]
MPSGACGAKSPGHSCTTASCVCCRPPGPRDVTPPLGTPHESGRRAEELAADFLRSQGFEILERNYRRRLGELDIIAERAGVLVIAEVRTRSSTAFGGAAASVDRRKQQRITRAATALLQQRAELSRLPVRFDVIVVWDAAGAAPRIEWLQHAFEAC